MMFNGVLHAMAGAQRLGVPHMRAVLPEQKPDSIEDVLKVYHLCCQNYFVTYHQLTTNY